MRNNSYGKHEDGFTLVELSIVLVIIGIIIGGILVGQDLIRAATIRSQVAQIEKFDTAVNSFKLKFNCLPGDCLNATDYGFTTEFTAYMSANGDGNGIISGIAGAVGGPTDSYGENLNFWWHLYQAGLIPGYTCNVTNCTVTWPGGTNYFQLGITTPSAKLDANANGSYGPGGVGIAWTGNYNPYTTSPAMQVPSAHVYEFSSAMGSGSGAVFRPTDIAALDSKMDDGLPASGIVRSSYPLGTNGFQNAHGGWTPNVCTDNSDVPNVGVPPTKYMNHATYECIGFIVQARF